MGFRLLGNEGCGVRNGNVNWPTTNQGRRGGGRGWGWRGDGVEGERLGGVSHKCIHVHVILYTLYIWGSYSGSIKRYIKVYIRKDPEAL